jgi:hypothetical protein
MARYEPDIDAFPAVLGGQYTIENGQIDFDPQPRAPGLVQWADDSPDPRTYRPLAVPALTDPNPGGHDEETTRPAVAAWIAGELAPALAREYPAFGVEDPLRFVVEVQFEHDLDAFTLIVDADGTAVQRRSDPEWDAIVQIAGSLFWEVVQGRRSWGDVLLAGALRAHARAYTPFNGRVIPAPVAPTFLYYALPYDRSVERAVAWDVAELSRS